ncbi:hypothetical protein B0H66DRAFT_568894 [Apodospora peruviana]|uniref:Uncharacterized protein n=1 Tax=Apodospora peruviana TaxID=516989 RepID=A0AAE0LYW9_9PEZI|nr:hypothetical protein B0H66DRAFT_568894 [Apodospora peruviana]
MDTPHAMSTSLQVYISADVLGIPSLKLLAKERFYDSVQKQIVSSSANFVSVVDEIYSMDSELDLSILEEICVAFMITLHECEGGWELTAPILSKHAELSMSMLRFTYSDVSTNYMLKDGSFRP